jgi:S1-C subfamily serine protease
MRRWSLLLVGWLLSAVARAGEPAAEQALALQKTIQKVIGRAEPAIACILVSRSDLYHKLAKRPNADVSVPGKLGAFTPSILFNLDKEEQKRLRAQLDLADPRHVPEAFGSGVVMDPKGLVLTNYHVVQDATKIFVRLPGGTASYADIHAADPRSDLAVLRLLTPGLAALEALPMSKDTTIERGQFVVALANPYAAGFRDGQPSASWGIISSTRRRAPGILAEEDANAKPLYAWGTLLQTDVRLNLGCSGGALVNLRGELIGLTTALAAIQGTDNPGGFAVPLDASFRRIAAVLLRGEEVEYGFLGVGFSALRTTGGGAGLERVISGSPADVDAKLRPRDVLLAIDGQPVRDVDDAFLALGMQLAGARVALNVRRAGRTLTTHATLAKFTVAGTKIASSPGKRPFVRGLRVDHASVLVQRPHSLLSVPPGVVVSEVQPESAAAQAGLKTGDIIMQVNQQRLRSPAAFYEAVSNQQEAWELLLYGGGPNEPPTKVVVK